MMLISLILTIIQAVIALLNGQPINEIPLGVNGEISITLDTLAGTFTATNLWFVSRTPDIPDPPPEPPVGYIGIYDIDDLQAIGNDPAYPLDGYYVLMNDIDASATATWNGGAGFAPIGPDNTTPFTGTLDGQGFGVTDLYIDRPMESFVGLVGIASGGTITNCHTTGTVTGQYYVGGLVGSAEICTITNCYATGAVTGTATATVGGLVGYASDDTIINCYATGTVTGDTNVGGLVGIADSVTITNCYATGTVTGTAYVGGLVGQAVLGTTDNCYATGTVTGDTTVGGLVGYASDDTIINCYAAGAVTGANYVGGLVGIADSVTVTASYYDATTSGQADNIGKGMPRTTAAMMQQATFSGWDFGVVWTIDEGVDYPRLMWE